MTPAVRCILVFVLIAFAGLVAPTGASTQVDDLRTVQFETTQVTAPDVVISPDGEWLIFTMLGKLFRLPVNGGEAEQLTFGPYYDNDPVISPDGRLVAFQSDRDGSEGNIFVLALATGAITQLTREPWADRPSWSSDGQSLVYLQAERQPNRMNTLPFLVMNQDPILVRRVRLAGGKPQTLHTGSGGVGSPFYLPDGRVGWAVLDRDSTSRRWTTRIEVRDESGRVSILRVLDGAANPIVPSPRGDGVYARTADGIYPRDFAHQISLLFAPFAGGAEQLMARLSGELSDFGVATNNAALYFGNLGHLWKVAVASGQREAIPFHASVTLVIREPTPPPTWTPPVPGVPMPLRAIQQPELSPDGSQIVFRALDRLWRQPLDGGQAQLLVDRDGTQSDPAFSPDGSQLAFIHDAQGRREIQIVDFQSGNVRTVGPSGSCGYEYLTWSPHGELVVALGGSCRHQVIAIEPADGSRRVLTETSHWEPYPQLSADGRVLYFQAEFAGSAPAFYALELEADAKPEPLLPAPAEAMKMSTQGHWVVRTIPNRLGIQLVRFDDAQAEVREFSEADGRAFSFTPSGDAVLYVAGSKLWRQPLAGGARTEIPIRLTPQVPSPPPVLLQRVRVLDFAAGGFGSETSILIERGRIRRVGSARSGELPSGTVIVDAAGRFAIPGLFDMHGHGGGCGGAARIAYGVTSVRNMGGSLDGQNAYADRSDATSDAIPRCFYAGEMLEAPQGNTGGYVIHLFDDEDARSHVRLWLARGAQFIKLYEHLPWTLQRAAADEARSQGAPVQAHGITLEQVVKGVTMGYRGLAHWERFYDDALLMFAATGTQWDPNLGSRSGIEVSYRDDPERFRDATPVGALRSFGDLALRGAWAEMLRTMGAAYRRGVTLLPGTDGGPDGLALQWELEFFAEAGIPPLEVLRFATEGSAKALGAGNDLGALEVGKLADVILLDANPLIDIKNTQAIWRVLKGGWMFDPKILLSNRD